MKQPLCKVNQKHTILDKWYYNGSRIFFFIVAENTNQMLHFGTITGISALRALSNFTDKFRKIPDVRIILYFFSCKKYNIIRFCFNYFFLRLIWSQNILMYVTMSGYEKLDFIYLIGKDANSWMNSFNVLLFI